MNDEYRSPNFDNLETAVKVVLREPIPEDAIDRVKARAKLLTATTVLPSHAPGWSWGWAAVAAVAASLILAFTLRSTVFGPPNEPAVARNVTPSPSAEPKADTPSVSGMSSPPTLLAYERTFAQSDETLERLLSQQAHRLDLRSAETTPLCLFKMESIQ